MDYRWSGRLPLAVAPENAGFARRAARINPVGTLRMA
jgi:hypothetical protein